VTAVAAMCFAIGYLLVYAATAAGVDDQGQRRAGWFAERPWQALFGEPPYPQSPPGAQGPTG
jgi:hypothetical protein